MRTAISIMHIKSHSSAAPQSRLELMGAQDPIIDTVGPMPNEYIINNLQRENSNGYSD